MLKKISVTALLILTFVFIFTEVKAQKSAEQLLKSVIDNTKAYKTLEVDFSYRMLNTEAGIDELKKGSVSMMGDAYKLEMAGQMVVCDAKTVWTYLEDSQEVMVSNAEKSEDAITPSSILTSYYEDYKASFTNDKVNTTKGLKTIELKPNKIKKFVKIQIGVNESKQQIVNFSIYDNGGNTFVYDITRMTPNVPMKETDFKFNTADYPGVDVVDMR
jgi:outer membrane lipoprotein-sorting protein